MSDKVSTANFTPVAPITVSSTTTAPVTPQPPTAGERILAYLSEAVPGLTDIIVADEAEVQQAAKDAGIDTRVLFGVLGTAQISENQVGNYSRAEQVKMNKRMRKCPELYLAVMKIVVILR